MMRRAAAALAALLTAGGCARGDSDVRDTAAATAADTAALPSVDPPDFSALAPAVRSQMEAGAEAFSTTVGRSGSTRAERATAYGEFGMLLMAAGFRATAERCFLNAEALAPNELRWPYYLGHVYRRGGRIAEAAAAFERAVRADGRYMPALVWLGNAYLDQGEPDKAAPLFEKALSLEPDTIAALFGLGRAALARGDHRMAVRHLERVLQLDPAASVVHHPLAMAYRALGETAKAASHLARHEPGGELRPPDPLDVPILIETAVGYEVRGTRALEAGDWAAAVASLTEAIRLAPEDPALRHKYATALALNGDFTAASRELATIARRRPDFAKAHYSLGLIKAGNGDVAGAIESLTNAVRAAPTYLEARVQLAHALRRSGQPARAVPEYTRVLDIDPRVVEARFGRAMALVRLGRYAEARDQLQEGMAMHPDEAGFALALARVLSSAPDSSVRDGSLALSIVDRVPESMRRIEWGVIRARALAEAGRFDEAVQLQRAVIGALEKNGSPELAKSQSEVLTLYEQRRASRTPWRRDEPMELPDSGITAGR